MLSVTALDEIDNLPCSVPCVFGRVGHRESFANGVDPLAKSFPCSQFSVATTFKDDASKWHESLTQNWSHTKFGELPRQRELTHSS